MLARKPQNQLHSNIMPTRSRNSSTGIVKLSQDLAKLLNNRHGSDVQFKIGGGTIDPNIKSASETTLDSSAVVTMYAHSAILRCRSPHFAVLLKNEKEWKDRSGGIISIPDMLPVVFHKILEYIYTGDAHLKTENLPDLIAAAEEMGIEELGIKCQTMVMHVLEQAFSKEDSEDDETMDNFGEAQNPEHECLPIDVAVRDLLIPVLKLAHNLNLVDFFQQLFGFTISHIDFILSSSDTRVVFLSKIPTPIFAQILAADTLVMHEYDVWELALSTACYKTMVSKPTVEAHFKLESNSDPEDSESESQIVTKTSDSANSKQRGLISDGQLKQLKLSLTPLLPAVRFSLMDGDQYSRIVEALNYFLPSRRSVELQRFYAQSHRTQPLDLSRLKTEKLKTEKPKTEKLETETLKTETLKTETLKTETLKTETLKTETLKTEEFIKDLVPPPKNNDDDPKMFSKIIDKVELWQQMKNWIFESNGIAGCLSVKDLKLSILFRASEHEFLAKAFHEHCDYKGPTLTIVKSGGHLFGGVNFADWESKHGFSGSSSNFLFALADGDNRTYSLKFTYHSKDGKIQAVINHPDCGPAFGATGYDLAVADKCDCVLSVSRMPHSYRGNGASWTALAGSEMFYISEYEVFAISSTSKNE